MPRKLKPSLVARAKKAIRAYGHARRRFRQVQDELKEAHLLVGNDNKVGVAGEFWAILYYEHLGYSLHEIPARTNNEDFDFKVSKKSRKPLRISVKSITTENAHGKTTLVRSSGDWDQLCIVLLDENLAPTRFGIATRKQFGDRFARKTRAANRRWLNQGWMAVKNPPSRILT
jgi:hypothetical protein